MIKIEKLLRKFIEEDNLDSGKTGMEKIEEYSLEVLESWMDDYDKWGEFYEWLKENLK